MKSLTEYINESSSYVSKSGRTGNDNFEGSIYDVTPPAIEFEKARKLLKSDKKEIDGQAYAKFLKLSNKKFKVCNRTYALLQHIKNNGGSLTDALTIIQDVWTGYFTFEDIFDTDDLSEIESELENVLD